MTSTGNTPGNQLSARWPLARPRTHESPADTPGGGAPLRSAAEGTDKSAAFELTQTTVSYDWEQVEYGPDGDQIRLSLSARLDGPVRGTIQRSPAVHYRLTVEEWELTGPPDLPELWAHRVRHALAQLRLRLTGQPHTSPDPDGRWDVSVRQRLRITEGQEVPGQLTPQWAFTPTQMFVEASTSGRASLCLFGTGPVETDSKRYDFAVGRNGVVAFDQLDSDDQVPLWAQEPARKAARLASDLGTAGDQQLIDETIGTPA